MRPRLRQRLLQTAALLVVTVAGVWAYQRVVRPDRMVLVRLAEAKLHEIFGPGVEYDHVRIDLLEGVTIEGLRVRTPQTNQPTLEARTVRIRHDLLGFAAGAYQPEEIHIEGARIVTHETEDGIGLDFPFRMEASEASGVLPSIKVRDSQLLCRAREGSTRLGTGNVLTLGALHLDVTPIERDRLYVEGAFQTRGLGQDDVDIQIGGSADAAADRVELRATWDPLQVTPALLEHLASELAAPLRGQAGTSGRLSVTVTRRPEEEKGRLRVTAEWSGQVRVDLSAIPGTQAIDAKGLEQIQRLFESPTLDVVVSQEGVNIEGLVGALAGGKVHATGEVRDGGEVLTLDVDIKRLRIEHPSVRDTFDPEAQEMFDAFAPSGVVDAFIHVTKSPKRGLQWRVDAILEDASFSYLGTVNEEGKREGFPYPVTHATGQLHIEQGTVTFEDIVGIGGGRSATDVLLLGANRKGWMGGETGRIRITDDGPEILLSVLARNVAVDRTLDEGVAGSEFADMRDQFLLEGVIDKVELDIISVPKRDPKARTSVRLTLRDEGFRYARFPLPLQDVDGWVEMTRPFISETVRGELFRFDVDGRTQGAPVHVSAEYRADTDVGRLEVQGENVPLAGDLTATILEAETTKEGLGPVWRWLDPRGRADVAASLPLGEDSGPIRVDILLRGASIRLDAEKAEYPLEVSELRGRVQAVDSDVVLEGLQGTIRGVPVTVDGTMVGGPEGEWNLHIRTEALRVDHALLEGLKHLAGDECFIPGCADLEDGTQVALSIDLHRDAGPEGSIRADVHATGLDGIVRFPSGVTMVVRGDGLRVHEGHVVMDGVEIEVPGLLVDVHHADVGGERSTARIVLHLQDFRPDDDVLALLPDEVRQAFQELLADRTISSDGLEVVLREDGGIRLDGDLELLAAEDATPAAGVRGALELRPLELTAADAGGERTLSGRVVFRGFSLGPDIPLEDLDGEARIDRLRLGDDPSGKGVLRATSARVLDLRVEDVHIPFVWQSGILRVDPLVGTVSEGKLRGRVLLHTREPLSFEGAVAIQNLQLEGLQNDLAPTGPPVRGRAQATITFQSRSGDLKDLTARGTVSVRDGDLGDLPVVATIFAFMGQLLGVEDPPRFQRLLAEFTLREEILRFRRFDLAGPLFDMPGTGTVDLGGFVDLTFTPDMIKSFVLPGVMQLPVIGPVLDAVLREDLLYAIRLRGDTRTATPEVIVLPPLGLNEEQPFEGTGEPQLPARRIPRWFR